MELALKYFRSILAMNDHPAAFFGTMLGMGDADDGGYVGLSSFFHADN
jgi:hypothetical protein